MKRFFVLFLFSFLFLVPTFSLAQGAHRISQIIVKGNGIGANISPNAKILVCVVNTGCATAANIYLDAALTTPAKNPVTADGSGNYDYYLASSCVDEQISAQGQGTIFVPNVCPFSGTSGGGATVPPPSFAVPYANSAVTAFNADSTFLFNPTTHGLSALLTNGGYNTDPAQSGGGNNGLGNLEAGACAGGGCAALFPAISTSTESPVPTVSNTVVQDYRGGGVGTYFYNPSPSGAAGYNPGGAKPSSGIANIFNYDKEQINAGAQNQVGTIEYLNSNAPGWSWGTNTGETGFSDWSVTKGHTFSITTSSPGIAQWLGGTCTKYSIGDSACAGYIYNNVDAGYTSPSDEGEDALGLHLTQNATWFHGTAGVGATTGTQALPTTYVSGTYSRTAFAVGGYMIDTSRALLTFASVTGAATQMLNSGPWSFPVSATVTESTAWGYANAAVPTPVDPTTASTDTVAFTVTGGTNAGGYTTGKAWLDGAEHMEQVMITAVGTISGGIQSVTFTHRYPNTQTGTYLFQGGTNGFYNAAIYSASPTYGGWRTGYPVLGAIDSSHLVGRFASVSNYAIPSFYNANTTNVLVTNLSVSGTTVTANINSQVAHNFDALTSAVISGATNSAYNGTVSNIHLINDAQLQWTQTVTGTSASASISYPATYYQFNLFPGAEVVQPSSPATPTVAVLEPNNVGWVYGDTIENVQQASFRGAIITGNMYVGSPDSQLQTGIGAYGAVVGGPGVSGAFSMLSYNNSNAYTLYQGGGGLQSPPSGIVMKGPMSTTLSIDHAPVDHAPVIAVGCAIDGCGTTNSTNLISVNFGAGTISFYPATNQFFLTGIETPKIQANTLSTGYGNYQNGGVPGLPVALTAASSAQSNFYSSLGTYAMFGNEGVLDTSADIGAHAFYAGTLYAGAQAPTGSSVAPVGTTGSSTYSYEAVSNTQNGTSVPSNAITTSIGNATLNGTNYNFTRFIPGKGAQSVDVYRTAAPAGYALGRICTAVSNLNAGGLSPCTDTGQTATGSLPSVDTSGLVQSAAGVFGSVSGTGTATFTLGGTGIVGTGATTPACYNVCDSTQGVATFTSGTGASSAGVALTVNLPFTRADPVTCFAQIAVWNGSVLNMPRVSCGGSTNTLVITTDGPMPAAAPVTISYSALGK